MKASSIPTHENSFQTTGVDSSGKKFILKEGTFTIKGQIGGLSFTGSAQIAIKNAVGQTLYSGTAPIANGIINQTLQLDANIARGIYMAIIKANGAMSNIKFVVE
jgi:hypothetical protein